MRYFVPIVIIVLIGLMILLMRRKLTVGGGCCGTMDKPAHKVRVKDRDPAHYDHKYVLRIKGMHCENCAAAVENALNSVPGTWATVRLDDREADVLTKEPRSEEQFRSAFRGLAYTLTGVEEVPR